MSREQLLEEVQRLRAGIRAHRDSTRHELCWHHPALWGLLPEKTDPLPVVPEWQPGGPGVLDFKGIPLEQVSQLAEALTGELPAVSALPKPPMTDR
jgi:hypothetical protein